MRGELREHAAGLLITVYQHALTHKQAVHINMPITVYRHALKHKHTIYMNMPQLMRAQHKKAQY